MYLYNGIKERLKQLKKANDFVKYHGLTSLDKVITNSMEEALYEEQVNCLLTLRREVRLMIRKIVQEGGK